MAPAAPASCNTSPYSSSTTGLLITGAGGGGASNCATGAGGTNQGEYGITGLECQGWPKPSWQSGSSLSGGQAVYGQPADGVRDIPDVSLFSSSGLWGHFATVCWSDPTQTSGGAATCTAGNPAAWSGFGGTSVAIADAGRHAGAGQSKDRHRTGATPIPSTTRSGKTSTAPRAEASSAAAATPAPARAAVASSTT